MWHDYPGEWFEEEPSTEEELRRRNESLKALVGSDIALLHVDGQRHVDNAGEEERYLKALLTNYIAHVSRVRTELVIRRSAARSIPLRLDIWAVESGSLATSGCDGVPGPAG